MSPVPMSKPVKLVLILSIAVNAIWVFGAASDWFSLRKTAEAGQANVNADALSPETTKEMAAALSTNDAALLRDKLRSLGLPADVVREIVSARIVSSYEARRRAIDEPAQKAAAQRPYWRGKISSFQDGYGYYTAEQRNEVFALYRDERKQIMQTLGRDGEVPSQTQIIYPFLTSDKAQQFSDMDTDYYLRLR